jgi:uridine kinase
MTFEFRDAKRQNLNLLIIIAGGTGSGKTESSMRVATGLAGGKPFA